MKKRQFRSLSIYLLLFLIVGYMSSCRSKDGDVVVGQAKEDFNAEDQIKIGDAIHTTIQSNNQIFSLLSETDYPELYFHLNTMIDQITNTATVQHREDFDWKISILNNDEEANAFITPGGHLYIYTGLLRFFNGEHELVGAIAHEVAYADSDLLINQLKNEFGSKDLSKVLSNDNSDDIVIEMARSIKDMVYSEADVVKADSFCTDIICEFVWDGDGLLSILKRGGTSSTPINWLQSKPVDNNRLTNLNNLIYNRVESCGMPDSIFHQRYLDKVVGNLP